MSEKLLLCPFCGGEAVLNHGHMITATGQYLANVKCSECGIATRVVWSTDSPEEAVKEAIEAWNRRAEPAERTAKVTNWQTDPYKISRCKNCGEPSEKMNGDRFTYCPKCGCKLDWSK